MFDLFFVYLYIVSSLLAWPIKSVRGFCKSVDSFAFIRFTMLLGNPAWLASYMSLLVSQFAIEFWYSVSPQSCMVDVMFGLPEPPHVHLELTGRFVTICTISFSST